MFNRCGAASRPEITRATLFCERPKGHESPHVVYNYKGERLRAWVDDYRLCSECSYSAGHALDCRYHEYCIEEEP